MKRKGGVGRVVGGCCCCSRAWREGYGVGAWREGYGVGLWKVIQSGLKEFNNRVGFRVGNDRRVRFWKDRWCEEELLVVAFPMLFSIATDKEAQVDRMWEQVGEMSCWNPVFTRQINDQKLGEVEKLHRRLQGQVIKGGAEDIMGSRLSKGCSFAVKSFYSLASRFLKGFPTSIMWNPWVLM